VKRVANMEISYQPLFFPNPRIRDPHCFNRRNFESLLTRRAARSYSDEQTSRG
jgi:hypothetical protein